MKQVGFSIAKAISSALLAVVITTTWAPNTASAGPRQAGIVVDAKSGKVMYSEDPDGLRYPASLTKMMTLYMVFEALETGRVKLNSPVRMSPFAASQAPTKLGVPAGKSFTVEQGILALVTRSANDCSTAFAELLGGSQPRFGKLMTSKARNLGMTRTVYYNANGLPDPRQVTTARDQARLGMALRKHFPQYYSYFSVRSFRYGKQTIGNHNRLLGAVRGVDGIKTGFTRAAGFNLVTSAQADGRSVVGVVLGSPSGAARNAKMRKLVEAYLPRASRKGNGGSDMIAAKVASEIPLETAMIEETRNPAIIGIETEIALGKTTRSLQLPFNGPVPLPRYEQSAKAAQKSVADAIAEESNLTEPNQTEAEEIMAASVNDEVAALMPSKPAKVDSVMTASTSNAPSGWIIQIGAAPEESQAMVLLQKAQDQGGKVLRSATPFTIAFVKDNEQLYRARFGGFANQDGAVNACNILKKKGFGCWAALQ